MDIFERINKNRGDLGVWQKHAHGYFMFPKLEGEIGPKMKFRGKEVLVWSINNYLGLANQPEVRKADAQAAKEWGLASPMGARMMTGQTSLHEQLEKELADFVKKPAAYLLNYGYPGMTSIIDSLVGRHDVIVYDSDAHACIIDGMRMHIGKRFVYTHNNIASLEKQLERASKVAEEQNGGILVITEGVFGMVGDLGKLDEIVALKEKFKFRFLVDDAHGFGTMGADGSGTGTHFGVQDKIDIYFSTFAKSMAGFGAFVASEEYVIDYLMYNMRSQVYAKSLTMPMVIGGLKRLEMIRKDPSHRENLWKIVNALQSGLKSAGLDTGVYNSPVTPVFLKGTEHQAANVVLDMRENYNVFCSVVIYPVVPKGTILLRLIPTAAHSLEDVEYTVKVFKEVKEKLDKNVYRSDQFMFS